MDAPADLTCEFMSRLPANLRISTSKDDYTLLLLVALQPYKYDKL